MLKKLNYLTEISFLSIINHIAITCLFFRAITGYDIFLYLGSVLGILLFMHYLYHQNLKLSKTIVFLSAIALYSYILTFMNNFFSDGALFLILMFGSIGVAWHIVLRGVNYTFCWWLFYFSTLYFFISLFALGYTTNDIFAYSRNHVSVYFINATSLLYIASHQCNRKLEIIPVIITFIISILCEGLGGIIASGIFLYFIISFKLFKNYKHFKGVSFSFLFAIIMAILINLELILTFFITLLGLEGDLAAKLSLLITESLLTGNIRYEIWSEYISKLDFLRFFSGLQLNEKFLGLSNLHSSYFLLHARLGVFSILFIGLFIYSLIKLLSRNFLFGVCLMSILIRGFTDTTFLAGSSFDYILIFFLICLSQPNFKTKENF